MKADQNQDPEQYSDEVRPQVRKKKQGQYPTKNFLNKFKRVHYTFLRKTHSSFSKWRNIEKLEKKKWTTMKDYEDMYKIPEFK